MVQPTRTNEAWSADLRSAGSIRESALADLRAIIVKGLPYALGSHLPTGHPEFDSLVDEVAQETLLRVLDRLDTFERHSQFTTWVHKIAIRIAYSELRQFAGL